MFVTYESEGSKHAQVKDTWNWTESDQGPGGFNQQK